MSEATGDAMEVSGGGKGAPVAEAKGGIDVGLMLYFLFWYVGNYYVSKSVSSQLPALHCTSML